MGVFKNFFGVGDAAKAVGAITGGLDELFTSEEERLSHAELMERVRQQPAALQVSINKAEAQHRTVFVAGWRPAIGWTCGVALFYHYIVRDLLAWVLLNLPIEISAPPPLDIGQLITILGGMLGLAGLRTSEKKAGAAA